jgi:hypothetical protein
MNQQETLQRLAQELNNATTDGDLCLTTEYHPDLAVLTVTVEDREEFPIYVTVDDTQILCVTHLWREEEVVQGQREALLDAMLIMNAPMPLSAFSKVGQQYILFGALFTEASVDEILEEIDTLSHNTLLAIEELSEFLHSESK